MNAGNYCEGGAGALPSSGHNNYGRRIGAGFFTEWGGMESYVNTDFVNGYYWTREPAASNRLFEVHSNYGYISSFLGTRSYAVCSVP